MEPERLVVGRIVKPHGILGEVAVDVTSDVPDRFAAGAEVDAGGRALTVESSRPHQGRLLVKFRESADRNTAETLRGLTLTIPATDARALPPGSYYAHQLEGCAVVDELGTPLGSWVRVEGSPAHDVWVVRAAAGEVLVPAVREIVLDVDLDGRRIVVRPPPGMFDEG